MKDVLKKGFILGLGAASLTKKKAEKTINSIVKAGNLTKNEGKQMITTVLREANKQRKALEMVILTEVKKQIKQNKPKIKKTRIALEKEGKKVAAQILKKIK
jgi:polyhydroxyalkanoate synthesis regulator phasin